MPCSVNFELYLDDIEIVLICIVLAWSEDKKDGAFAQAVADPDYQTIEMTRAYSLKLLSLPRSIHVATLQ